MATLIIYPQKRWVSAEKIATWFNDAIANGQIAPQHLNVKTEREQAAVLSNIGIITVEMHK